MRTAERVSLALGLIAVLAYWFAVRPYGLSRGYIEDMCLHEMARQIMAENLAKWGHPSFDVTQVMAPFGMNGSFMAGWILERDWLGGYVWNWNREFPFLWAYFGASLLITYLGVGFVTRKILGARAAVWWIALGAAVVNVARHYKLWHHSDNVMLHWVYLGFFVDAWIWDRFVRKREWSLAPEAWRVLILQLNFDTMGYMWGPSILGWMIVRAFMLGYLLSERRRGVAIRFVRGRMRDWLVPTCLGLAVLPIQLAWFIPFARAAMGGESIRTDPAWFANGLYVIRPLWLDYFSSVLPSRVPPFWKPETVVTIGWFFLLPMFLALRLAPRKRGGAGAIVGAPFLVLLAAGVMYLASAMPVIELIQLVMPLMRYFRTSSRWGVFLSPICLVIIVLYWSELSAWVRRLAGRPAFRVAVAVFVVSTCAELAWLATPPNSMVPITPAAAEVFRDVKALPGTTVLTLPFCVTGGNGTCGEEQCPGYPGSTVGACTRLFHDKKVYGMYASRFRPSDCELYRKEGFTPWFNAWREGNCPADADWHRFCEYLDRMPDLSALLVFPEAWQKPAAVGTCREQFEKYLGKPLAEADIALNFARGGVGAPRSQMLRYAPKCRAGTR